ncbi:hypothetical protein K438DRAFT_1947106 [Mycena galopus ATCC 62051]|nr:hypothetical protein K438DRAFT_1947106 [Mycena galopus ATCC 62051]
MRLGGLSLYIWLHVVRAATAASSSDSAAPSATTSFSFTSLPNMTTCEPAVISWQFSSSIVPTSFSLAVWSWSSATRVRNFTTAVAPPTFTWQAVDVPQALYQIVANWLQPNDTTLSLHGSSEPIPTSYATAFFVSNGTNTSCLDLAVSISSAPKINHGTIAGVAITGFFVVLGAIIFILRRRSRAAPTAYPRRISDSPMPTGQVTSARVLSGPPNASETVIAFERPIAPAVVESQEAMFLKLARMREEMHIRERRESGDEGALDTPSHADAGANLLPSDGEISGLEVDGMGSPSDFAQQFRAMAQRVALIEARMGTDGISDEQPPEYM